MVTQRRFKTERLVSMILLIAIIMTSVTYKVKAADITYVYYEKITYEDIAPGLKYEKRSRLTEQGWVDIHVLKMDTRNPLIDLEILRSKNGFGYKASLSKLIQTTPGAVAAINATFFNTRVNPTDIMGVEYNNGFVVAQDNYNVYGQGSAALIQSTTGMFVDFFSTDIIVFNEKGVDLNIFGINKLDKYDRTLMFNRTSIKSSNELPSLAPLYKVVVNNGLVEGIKLPNEEAIVPENGYIITFTETLALTQLANYTIGQPLTVKVATNFSQDGLKRVISGGGRIIKNGNVVSEGDIITPNSKQPRSALGVTKDGNYLIAMVVDGRGVSIGATHQELAGYLKLYDVYNGMYCDGGGSSTLIAKSTNSTTPTIKNELSEGSERQIINGIGFVNNATVGAIQKIELIANKQRTLINKPVTFTMVGMDEYMHTLPLNVKDIYFSSTQLEGTWEGNKFTPRSAGTGTITCHYGDFTSTVTVTVVDDLMELLLSKIILSIDQGGTGKFAFTGVDYSGYRYTVDANAVSYQLENPNLGQFVDGVFKASDQTGISKVIMTAGNVSRTAYIVVGNESGMLSDMENLDIQAIAYPETAKSSVALVQEPQFDTNQTTSIELGYNFPAGEITQAAYCIFKNPIKVDKPVSALMLKIFGDNSGLTMKARVIDAENKEYYLSFADAIGFSGWKTQTAAIPAGMVYPIAIERIYIATLKNEQPLEGKVYFDLMTYTREFDISQLDTTKPTQRDPFLVTEAPQDTTKHISIFGSTAGRNSLLDELLLNKMLEKMNQSQLAIFSGKTAIDSYRLLVPNEQWNDQYKVSDYDQVKLIYLSTGKKSLFYSDVTQWNRLSLELAQATQKNIVIIGNANPLTGFEDAREGQMVHTLLKDFVASSGKNVAYINANGYKNDASLYEGVRYFNINGLWYQAPNNRVNLKDTFKVLDFYFNNDKMSFRFNNLFD